MLLKIARERRVRFSANRTIARISAPQCTAARSEKNLPTASKNESMLLENDAEASAAVTSAKPTDCARRHHAHPTAPAFAAAPTDAARRSELVVGILGQFVVVGELVVVLVGLVLVDVVEAEVVLAKQVVVLLVLVGDRQPLAGPARFGDRGA